MTDIQTVLAAIVTVALAIAAYLPKLLNTIKGDKIDGTILDRVERHEKRMDTMDALIHKQQIKLTRLQVLVIQLLGMLKTNHVDVPVDVQEEADELILDDKEGAP